MGLNNLILLAEDTTIGEAGLNTLMGISIVFLSLAFISFVISLFKLFNRAGKKKEVKETVIETAPVAVDEEAEDLSSDEELAAVITAAIYAYEAEQGIEMPADGLFVRSIRRTGCRRMA